MALPPTYASRTPTSVVPLDQRRIDNGVVAEGVALLGRAGSQAVAAQQQADDEVTASKQRMAEAEARRDRQMEAVRQSARLTEVQVEASKALAELEREPPMFGIGHQDNVKKTLAAARATYIEGLPRDEEIRANATRQWDVWAARQQIQAEAFEAQRRIADQGAAWEQSGAQSNAMLFASPTPENFAAMLDQDAATLSNMAIADGDKAELYNQRARERAQALLSGLIEQGRYDEVDALRKSELLSQFLPYQDSQRFRGLAENGRTIAAREAEMQVEAARDAWRSQIENAQVLIKEGVTTLDIPLAEILRNAPPGLDPAELTEAQGLVIGLEVNRRYSNPTELTSHIRQMEARAASGDLSQNEQRMLYHMRERLDGLATGRAAEFEDDWKAGGRQQVNATARLMSLPMAERVSAARALDPSGNLRYAVQLPKATTQAVVRGQQVRAANKQLLPVKEADVRRYRRVFDAATGNTLSNLNEEARAAMFDMSLDVLADSMSRHGRSEFDEAQFRQAISMAMGRASDTAQGRFGGGLGSWNGQAVWLPPSSDNASFARQLRAMDFKGAAEPAAKVLKDYTPFAVVTAPWGAKKYQFIDETGAVLGRADGKGPYEAWIGG